MTVEELFAVVEGTADVMSSVNASTAYFKLSKACLCPYTDRHLTL